jgi:hypothetical protein
MLADQAAISCLFRNMGIHHHHHHSSIPTILIISNNPGTMGPVRRHILECRQINHHRPILSTAVEHQEEEDPLHTMACHLHSSPMGIMLIGISSHRRHNTIKVGTACTSTKCLSSTTKSVIIHQITHRHQM